MLTHGCAATFLLITQCYAHHGRLPPATNRIWIFVSTLSQHLAFENRRCLETPWWERCVARRSIAPCRCLDRRGESVSPRGRRWEACCENLAQSGRDLALAPSSPELVSAFAFSIRRDGFFSPISIATRRPVLHFKCTRRIRLVGQWGSVRHARCKLISRQRTPHDSWHCAMSNTELRCTAAVAADSVGGRTQQETAAYRSTRCRIGAGGRLHGKSMDKAATR